MDKKNVQLQPDKGYKELRPIPLPNELFNSKEQLEDNDLIKPSNENISST